MKQYECPELLLVGDLEEMVSYLNEFSTFNKCRTDFNKCRTDLTFSKCRA
ncbi:hypothetical protein T458_24500 [Brevibacillus panacihumi W25]|uniref:Uncharacterized protein n=1 Tax=Brevibacillus panacihumi W25 TaxID=1408254 RepID=V6M0N8_9BACL|nr:hypothetical protein T458_24500 [Brevibacillus panacihumi W25]